MRTPDPSGALGSVWATVWSTTLSGSVPLVKTHWSSDTVLIRDEDYAFVNPPAGLATNLLATQNWLPYQGTVDYVLEEIPAGHHVGKALNVVNIRPEYATMKALISGMTVRPATGQITLTLGPPDRLSWRNLVNRFRQSGSKIVWLNSAPVLNAGS